MTVYLLRDRLFIQSSGASLNCVSRGWLFAQCGEVDFLN